MSKYIGILLVVGIVGGAIMFWNPTVCGALNNLTNGQFDMCAFQSTASGQGGGGGDDSTPQLTGGAHPHIRHHVEAGGAHPHVRHKHPSSSVHLVGGKHPHVVHPHTTSVVKASPTPATKKAVPVVTTTNKCSGQNCRFDSKLGGFFDDTHCKCVSGLGAKANMVRESHIRMSGW